MVAKKVEYDFDNWSAEAEESALAEVQASMAVQYVVVENAFVGRFPDGTVMKLPFSVTIDDIDVVGQSGSEVDGIKSLFTRIGGEDAAASFASQPLPSANDYATKYFGLFRKINGIAVGE